MRSLERSPVSASPCFFISESTENHGGEGPAHLQDRRHDSVYNTKTAIQTVWCGGGTSDSVVIVWWTSLCDANTGACVQWLDCFHEVSGFSLLRQSPGSPSDKKIHAGSSSNDHLLGKTRKSPVRDWRHAPPAHADAAAGADSKYSAGPQRHKNEQFFSDVFLNVEMLTQVHHVRAC